LSEREGGKKREGGREEDMKATGEEFREETFHTAASWLK